MDVIFLSKRIFIDDEFIDGAILVTQEGKIQQILRTQDQVNSWMYTNEADETFDFGNRILMPGLIDSHVHINEPGRTDWEGFVTATKAAAAGGFTTIVDMPLNSIPPTTTVANLKTKKGCARGKIYIDLAFWGGYIPTNIDDLEPLIDAGVVGFKCFLCPSGVPEFPNVTQDQVELAFQRLQSTDTVFAFHAEICGDSSEPVDESEPKKYETYLQTRPSTMEMEAIEFITEMAVKYKVRTHIVHLATADAIPVIRRAREQGARITVETCHHYLSLAAEDVPDGQTEYKCAPPIRDRENQQKLWKGIVDGDIDMIVSDHSPSTPGVKMLTYGKNRGNFLKAWGGISSVQLGLSLFWTKCRDHGLDVKDMVRLMCTKPAELCGLSDRKGQIKVGYDADFCIWDPDEEFTVTPDMIYFQNKANPYMDRRLRGTVHATVVRGLHVYQEDEKFEQPMGQLIMKSATKKIVKFS